MTAVNAVWKLVRENAKAVAVWVAGVLVTAVMNVVNGVSPWPVTWGQWGQYLLTSFTLAFAAWLFPNKITQKQLDKDPYVVGGTVVAEKQAPPTPPAGECTNPWV